MKIFWSWQSDTPGKTGRHFVRAALVGAVDILKQPQDIEEPAEREAREALHVDQDRQDVPGSPDLARTIFGKIERADVFVADVTSVGDSMAVDSETDRPKKLMNSNVAIEYGFAERAISDQKILLVQNEYYGGRNDLPFDLKHKAGPIRYNLAPDANPTEIESAKVKLRGAFVGALRPFLATRIEALVRPAFTEIQAQPRSPAYFADGNCVLASVGKRGVDEIEYRLREARVFYLRLIPQRARDPQLRFSDLLEVINKRRVQTLSRQVFAGVAARNSFGGIVYEPSGDNPNPKSLTQLFQNGEIWGIGTGFHLEHQGDFIIPAQNVEGIVLRVLQNFCDIATLEFGVAPPFCVEMGGLCLGGAFLGAGMRGERFGPIHQEQLTMRRVISDVTEKSLQAVVGEFLDQLFNLAGVDRPALS